MAAVAAALLVYGFLSTPWGSAAKQSIVEFGHYLGKVVPLCASDLSICRGSPRCAPLQPPPCTVFYGILSFKHNASASWLISSDRQTAEQQRRTNRFEPVDRLGSHACMECSRALTTVASASIPILATFEAVCWSGVPPPTKSDRRC